MSTYPREHLPESNALPAIRYSASRRTSPLGVQEASARGSRLAYARYVVLLLGSSPV